MNIGVVGDLGKGKTQFLKGLLYNLNRCAPANRGIRPRVLIFDYKKDYSSPDFVKAVGARVIKPYRLPVNLFDLRGCEESNVPWLDRYGFFADVLGKIYSGIGQVQRKNLKDAVRKAYQDSSFNSSTPTVYTVRDCYDAIVKGAADSPLAILDDMVDRELFEPDASKTIPFSLFLDGVVVIDLGSLGQNDNAKNMLVAIMLNMFYEHMLRIEKRPFLGTDPQLRVLDSFLLVDEADNIMRYEFDVLRKLLLQGREFGVGVILASQYLSHFKASATNYCEPLLTWFVHQVPNVTQQELQHLGLTSQVAEIAARIKTLPNHHCLFKSYGGSAEFLSSLPFYRLLQENT